MSVVFDNFGTSGLMLLFVFISIAWGIIFYFACKNLRGNDLIRVEIAIILLGFLIFLIIGFNFGYWRNNQIDVVLKDGSVEKAISCSNKSGNLTCRLVNGGEVVVKDILVDK